MWKIVSHDRFHIPSPSVLLWEWTLEDVADAHLTIEMYERLERKAAQKMKAAANGPS